jgi:hypothetical protein
LKKEAQTTVTDVMAFEAVASEEVAHEISWKILDLMNDKGVGILPQHDFKTMVEEQ